MLVEPKTKYVIVNRKRSGARRDGGAGPGQARREVDGSVRSEDNRACHRPDSKTTLMVVSQEARTEKTQCTPTKK